MLRAEPNLEIAAVTRQGTASALRGQLGQIARGARDRTPEVAQWRQALEKVAPAFRVKPADLEHEKSWTDRRGNAHVRFRQRRHGLDVIGATLSLHADKDGAVYAAFGSARDDASAPAPGAARVARAAAREVAARGDGLREAQAPRLVYLISTRDQSLHLAWEVRVTGVTEEREIDDFVYVDAISGEEVDRHGRIHEAMNREVSKYVEGPPPYPYPSNLYYGWPRLLYRNEAHQADALFSNPSSQPLLTALAQTNWGHLEKAYNYFWGAHGRDSYDGAGSKLDSQVNVMDMINPNNAAWHPQMRALGFGTGFKAGFWECQVFNTVGQNVALNKSCWASSQEVWAQHGGAYVYRTANRANDGDAGSTRWAADDQTFPQTWTVDLGSTQSINRVNTIWQGSNRWMYRIETSPDNSTWTVRVDNTQRHGNYSSTDDTFSAVSARFVRVVVTGVGWGQFAADPDIVSHELAHGVTQFTSGLLYAGEPGALNEAFSDISSACSSYWNNPSRAVDAETWLLAETAYTPTIPGDAGRYMNDPAADAGRNPVYPELYSRDYYPHRYTGTLDYGGVHFNSGIANLAFYLAAQGGTHPRGKSSITVPPVGMAAAMKIFYDAFTNYLAPGSQFVDARAATVVAAANYPSDPDAAAKVALAWDAVGVPALDNNAHPLDLSTRADVGTGEGIMIAGFSVGSGGSKQVLLRGVGPRLASFGVPNALANPQICLFSGSAVLACNDNWGSAASNPAVAAATALVGAFSLADNSLDASMLYTLGAGQYTLQLSGVGGATGNAMVEVYDTNSAASPHLQNFSTRCLVTSSNPAIAGVIVQGQAHKRLLIRAVGPTLASFGLSGAIADPKIGIFVGDCLVLENDNWNNDPSVSAATSQIGQWQLPTGSLDAAVVVALPPGAFTVHVSGVNGSTGICLVEIYEVNGAIQ